ETAVLSRPDLLQEGLTERWPVPAAPRNVCGSVLLPRPRDCGRVPARPRTKFARQGSSGASGILENHNAHLAPGFPLNDLDPAPANVVVLPGPRGPCLWGPTQPLPGVFPEGAPPLPVWPEDPWTPLCSWGFVLLTRTPPGSWWRRPPDRRLTREKQTEVYSGIHGGTQENIILRLKTEGCRGEVTRKSSGNKGELLNPCRCDGSVRYTHQLCLLKWISERGSWTCELCCYRYHVIAIKMKQPCQWQSISITLVEKVQMIAVILGSLFLIASMTWLLWSAFSPYAVWQRKDILFQICYGMYGFMDLVCIGLIVHEGAAVYRVFKRWRAVNLHWDVLNYDKATDIEESSRGESSTSRTLWLPLTALRNRNLVHPTQLTSPRFQCGYVLLHLFNRMRPHEDLSEDNSSGEVVMRVTSV
uniref:RING-type E3 ubiquitin transferase n=1 Tax=Felis catus TaxID=9685 RepID=A0ABI7YYA1_FELCA